MTDCSKYNKLDTCPSPPICQWLNNKCKSYNLADLNNSFALLNKESFLPLLSNENRENESIKDNY